MIYTSSFRNVPFLPPDYNMVSISTGTPRGFTGDRFDILTPDWDLVEDLNRDRISWTVFSDLFSGYLLTLEVDEIAKYLYRSVLLSFDFKSGCSHRPLIVKWMRESGYEIEEISPGRRSIAASASSS